MPVLEFFHLASGGGAGAAVASVDELRALRLLLRAAAASARPCELRMVGKQATEGHQVTEYCTPE